jgi:hypothetical protein
MTRPAPTLWRRPVYGGVAPGQWTVKGGARCRPAAGGLQCGGPAAPFRVVRTSPMVSARSEGTAVFATRGGIILAPGRAGQRGGLGNGSRNCRSRAQPWPRRLAQPTGLPARTHASAASQAKEIRRPDVPRLAGSRRASAGRNSGAGAGRRGHAGRPTPGRCRNRRTSRDRERAAPALRRQVSGRCLAAAPAHSTPAR